MLACGEEGAGRLAEVGDIADAVETLAGPAHPALLGRAILITAGPTQEDLDPVRTLTNRSSGAMGIELARAFRNAGAKVSLVLGGGLPAPWGVRTVRVRSAQQMLEASLALWPEQDGLVAAAAVADQRPQTCAPEKVKKGEGPETLVLVRTPDVLATLSASRGRDQWLLGFAAESEAHVPNATAKLHMKHLDGIRLPLPARRSRWDPCPRTIWPRRWCAGGGIGWGADGEKSGQPACLFSRLLPFG
jgi:phosphopantothenoylcysteine decarboxylase/phosphopantothenate--cysteine ligase